MLAWIQFSDQLWPWSAVTFWMVVISVISTLGFTVAVFIGGLADLRFLLSALDEELVDRTDDGRVVTPPAEAEKSEVNEEGPRSSH
jgi:hypothetical protein